MQPVTEETLVLLYYGELDARDAEAVRSVLAQDPDLAERFARLSAELALVEEPPAPERDEHYGRRVWARVDAALDEAEAAKGISWLNLPLLPGATVRWAGGVLVLGMVAVIAFQMGRMAPPAMPQVAVTQTATVGPNAQARLLEASLARHFDSADRLLTEISNNQAADIDIESEKEWAKVLLVANRLYRFAAEQAGQHRIAQLLGDMEPVLIELANGAGQLTPDEYRELRQSIEARDLVFKVRTTNMALSQPQSGNL